MTTQLERNLQTEILYRLARYPVVACAVPNGIFLPAHNEAERVLVRRIVARMRDDGMLTPGAPDLVIAGERRCVMVELKRPASRDLFGRKPKGRLSPEQKAFRDRCVDCGVDYTVASSWEDVQCMLPELY
jgi:hypothetical protein